MAEPKATFPPAPSMKDAANAIRATNASILILLKKTHGLPMMDEESEFIDDIVDTLTWVTANLARSNEISAMDMLAILRGDDIVPEKAGFMECCVQTHDDAIRAASVLYAWSLTCGFEEVVLAPRSTGAAAAVILAGAMLLNASQEIAKYWNVTAEEMANDLRANGYDVFAASITERPYDTEPTA